MKNDELVGRNITRFRGTRSQADIAKMMRARGWKWSQGTISTIETGERPLRFNEAADLADILDVPLDSLLREEGDAEISARARVVASAANSLATAVEDYWEAQVNLAIVGDQAESRDGQSLVILGDWLAKRPEDIIAGLRAKHDAEAMAEEAQFGLDRSANQNGKFVTLLNENWDTDGKHQEEA